MIWKKDFNIEDFNGTNGAYINPFQIEFNQKKVVILKINTFL